MKWRISDSASGASHSANAKRARETTLLVEVGDDVGGAQLLKEGCHHRNATAILGDRDQGEIGAGQSFG
jgi:hypothetical protein